MQKHRNQWLSYNEWNIRAYQDSHGNAVLEEEQLICRAKKKWSEEMLNLEQFYIQTLIVYNYEEEDDDDDQAYFVH